MDRTTSSKRIIAHIATAAMGLFTLAFSIQARAVTSRQFTNIVVTAPSPETSATLIAVKRLKETTSATVHLMSHEGDATTTDLVVVLKPKSPLLESAPADTYCIETAATSTPLTITITSTNDRSMLYGVYRFADILKSGTDLTNIKLRFEP